MEKLKIHNWDKWQSYRRDRDQPPWIKIHRRIMRDSNWVALTDAQRGQLVAIWLLAADHDGVIPASPTLIKKLCFMESDPDLEMFITQGFIEGRRRPDATVTSPRQPTDADMTHQSRGEEKRDREEAEEKRIVATNGVAQLSAHQIFVEKFRRTYEARTGQPYKADGLDFMLAAKLMKRYTTDACEEKAAILADLCEKRTAWFTKDDGWGSFTLGKLSKFWNEILPRKPIPTKDDEWEAEKKRQEVLRVAADRAVQRK